MQQEKFKEYAKLYAKSNEIKAQLEGLKLELIEAMEQEGVSSEATPYGKFTKAVRTSFVYSEKVKLLDEKVKIQKKKEEQNGTATVGTLTPYIIFKAGN